MTKKTVNSEQFKPNNKELIALNLFYNRFYDLYDEISEDSFYRRPSTERFNKLKDIFSVYKELLGYQPIKYFLEYVKNGGRPALEGILTDDLFSFVRNLLSHYPIFDNWEDVYITRDLATWIKESTIHKFLLKCTQIKIDGSGTIKYRIWSVRSKTMTYISINLPERYEDNKIYLRDIISEKDGIKLCVSLMKQILDTQVENKNDADIKIMPQAYVL